MNQGRDKGIFSWTFATDYINLMFSSVSPDPAQKQTTVVTAKESEVVHLAPSLSMQDKKPTGGKLS